MIANGFTMNIGLTALSLQGSKSLPPPELLLRLWDAVARAVLAASPVLPRRPQPSAMTLPDLPSADASAPLDCPKTAFLDIVASSLARLDGCHHKVFESK